MTVNITIPVHTSLAQRLRPFWGRLPELLERGLQDVTLSEGGVSYSENEVLEILASNPSPEQILALRPSPEFQARVSFLLSRSKEVALSKQEEAELDRYFWLEHLVRLAKAHATQRLG